LVAVGSSRHLDWLTSKNSLPQVCVSNTHIVALTSDYLVFTWGEGRRGQLGHGTRTDYAQRPAAGLYRDFKSFDKVLNGY
jgi:alpha-tubulin suppressor-like RCC1 family protein